MAKPKPMIPAKARTINLVSHSPWSARENPPQDLGYPFNQVNVDEGYGCQTKVQGNLHRPSKVQTEFQNMNEVHKPSIHDEGLPLFAKEVGNYSRVLRICI